MGEIYRQGKRTAKTQAVCLELSPLRSIPEFPLPTHSPARVSRGAYYTGAVQAYLTLVSTKLLTFSGLTCAINLHFAQTLTRNAKLARDCRNGGWGVKTNVSSDYDLTRDCEGLPTLHSLLRKIFCYVFRVALTDNSMKLRILKICMFRFYSYGRCRVTFFFRMLSVFTEKPASQSSLSLNLVSLKAWGLLSKNVR